MSDNDKVNFQVLFEGETYNIYRIEDEDGEVGYDLNMFGTVTIHFMQEEWDEFLEVLHSLMHHK